MRAALALRISASFASAIAGAGFAAATGAVATSARSVGRRGTLRGVQFHSRIQRSKVRRETPIITAMSGTGVNVNS